MGTCINTIAKFEVENTQYLAAGAFFTQNPPISGTARGILSITSSTNNNATSIRGVVQSSGANNTAIGVEGAAIVNSGSLAIAINGNAANASHQSFAANLDVINSNSPFNYGIQNEIINTSPSSTNYGHDISVNTIANLNYGLRVSVMGATNGNIAVFASAPITNIQTPGGVPVGNDFAGFFNGDVVRTGTDNFTSDISLKTNIDTILNILHIISQLKPRQFYFTNANHPIMHLPTNKQFGFIAQDVETVLPELVMNTTFPAQYDTAGNLIYPSFPYKNLNYQAFHALSIRAIQELMKKIQQQDSMIKVLSTYIANCCSNNSNRQINTTEIELSNTDIIILNQNVPNPFAESTTIHYHIPDIYQSAQLIFSTTDGKVIKKIDLSSKKSHGTIKVYASDLSSGVYLYYLIVDGKVVETKRMEKTN